MRKLILRWLFDADVPEYIALIREIIDERQAHLDTLNDHINTLNERSADLDQMRKLIQICVNHSIDIDAELRQLAASETKTGAALRRDGE